MFKKAIALLPAFFISQASFAYVGGFMSNCYTGAGFYTDKVCEQRDYSQHRTYQSGHDVTVSGSVSAQYLDEQGNKVRLDLHMTLEDHQNYFDPEAQLPVLVRLIFRAGRSSTYHQVRSFSVIFDRVEGERKLLGSLNNVELYNNWGSKYVELLEKVEVLIPGLSYMHVLEY